ncbi:MAG: hypothetical protein ABI632_08335 [Pseudolysinimonas sp.]
MTDELAPKTFDAYSHDRAKLAVLKAPMKFAFADVGIDLEYRRDQKVEYLLGMVGHLLKRVEALEAEVAAKPAKPAKPAK